MSSDFPALYPLGIVGSGQIARMTHQAALKLGITPRLLAEDSDDSAALVASDASFSHPDAIAAFAEVCGVVTFEHDRIDLGLIERLAEAGTVIRPGIRALRAASDKMFQRRMLLSRGFNVPAFAELRGPDDLFDFTNMFGWPAVIKAVRASRSRKGAWVVDTRNDALRVMADNSDRELFIESFQPIVKELVVLLARRPGGNVRCYPVTESVSSEGACREVRSPAAIGHKVAMESLELSKKIAEEFDAVGLIAVELFLTTDGLMVNEIAARPHNAGHLTIEGCATSQFENHVRALLDLPLGPTFAHQPAAVMVNVIGGMESVDPTAHLAEALAVEGVHVHLYGKRPEPGAKLGHVTAIGDDVDQARELARRAEAALLNRRV